MGHSGSKTEELIDEMDFACRSTFPLDAMTAADHTHDFKTLQGCGCGFSWSGTRVSVGSRA
jgi:hypothetical protein